MCLRRRRRTAGKAFGARTTSDDRGTNSTDRRTDHPVEIDTSLIERLIDANLVGTQRSTALEHQNLPTECL
jgi:hypothetical protein